MDSKGNILSKNPIHKIQLKSKGISQFGGQSIWFDLDINRLNTDSRGQFLGEFLADDHILVICKNGEYYTTNFDLSNRYQGDIFSIEKLDYHKIYTALYFDGEQSSFYLKRFCFEPNDNTVQLFIGDSPGSYLVAISSDRYPRIEVSFTGKHQKRMAEVIDADEFIACKSFRAKGKRITTFEVGSVVFIEPLQKENNIEIVENGSDVPIISDEIELDSSDKETDTPPQTDPSPTLF